MEVDFSTNFFLLHVRKTQKLYTTRWVKNIPNYWNDIANIPGGAPGTILVGPTGGIPGAVPEAIPGGTIEGIV